METTVVHIKNVSLESDDVVYIGRSGKGQDGYFGNDHPIGKCRICNTVHDRAGSIRAYKAYFWRRVNEDDQFFQRVMLLEGKQLACFCKPKACHGDVIVAFLEWTEKPESEDWLKARFARCQ